jgi:hypothetical protein
MFIIKKHVGSDRIKKYGVRRFLKFAQIRKCKYFMKLLSLKVRSIKVDAVARTYNPSYSGDGGQETQGSMPGAKI